ncbi:MAG: hypothetical protein KME42_23960 [Tildeniella nuda ZEHNDER 1965/U140]|jgi:hypothetical protein|nr:hypothetical protein [Tildeniella nuda ZEHNDER 1965/U140]
MELERYEKWEPVEGITNPVHCARINEGEQGLSITLIFSKTVDGLHAKLRINFVGRTPAYTVHEEFVHPWNVAFVEPIPKLEGKWVGWTFPLLIVKHSTWLKSFSESQIVGYADSIHYRLMTLDKIVDVLYDGVPEASWVQQANSTAQN